MQARAAAAAFEQAFAMTVPPPVIAANRTQLMALIATNFFGQNTAAIAATEAQYAEMWAQDATAMYGYSSASAAAATLTPFAPPTRPPIRPARPARPTRSTRPFRRYPTFCRDSQLGPSHNGSKAYGATPGLGPTPQFGRP